MDLNGYSPVSLCLALFGNYLRKHSPVFLLLALLAAPAARLLAHGSLHEAIERKSRELEANPNDALLRFERGMLYQEHGDIGPALSDFHQVLQLAPDYTACHLPLAQLYRDTGNLQLALFHIGRFLEAEPDNPFGYETRAAIFRKAGAYVRAEEDLHRMVALKNENAIRPDDYFRLADGILLAYPGQYGRAIEALEEGLQRLGGVISLQSRLVDLEIADGRYAAALRRINRIMEPLARKEAWLAKRSDVLRRMQRPGAAGGNNLAADENGQAAGPTTESRLSPAGTTPDTGAPNFPAGQRLADVVRGPYLQSGTPTSMVVKWRTNTATNSVVWYGPSPADLTQVAEQSGSRRDHEITLSALSPNTRYYYAVGDSGGMLAGSTPNHFFRTSPPPGTIQPVRAWVLGDCGTADQDARDVRDGYYAYAGNQLTDLILLLGDNAYDDGTDSEYQHAIFENMYEEQLIQSVMWSTPGNHDYGSASASDQTGPYFDIFTFPKNGEAGGLPSGTEAYYSFDYANIHFVVLDSHDSGREPGDPMLVWLENDLAATQQDWIIAFFHHPPYSKGSHDSDDESKLIDMRENVLPLLEAAGADLVLCGHSHSYERSFFLNGHYGSSNTLEPAMILDGGNGRLTDDGAYRKDGSGPAAGKGAVYTVAGSSGKTSNGPLDHPVMYYSAKTLGSLSLEVMDKQLDLKFIGVGGEVLDYFTIQKVFPNGNPPAVAITAPADGAFYSSVQPVSLQAEASDSDGTIEAVAFFINGDSVGVDHSAPYALDWTPPAEGSFFVRARATDNDDNQVTSAEREFYVGIIRACSQVDDRENDAEEELNGNMSLYSTDLELVKDDGDQLIGMRFTGLNIPPNAVIHDAWIQFSVEDNNNDNPCTLSIHGQAGGNPAPFADSDNNISSRPLTQASVSWNPPDWAEIGDAGPAQKTPSLAPILQEIIAGQEYSASSPVVFIIRGEGRRTAESFDGLPGSAPQLCVEYSLCAGASIQATGSADNICPGQTVTLSAGPAAGYLWSNGATTAQVAVQPTQTTTYSLTAWDDNGCSAGTEVTITVLPAPQLSFASNMVSFCPGQGAEVAAPAGFAQYQWSDGQSNPTIFIDSPGTWSLTVTGANGCTASASLAAAEQPPLNLQASGSPLSICPGQSATLSAANAASYLWSTGAATAQVTVQPTATTAYSLTAWDALGCPATAEVTITVLPPPQPSFGTDTVSFCPGQGMEVTAPSGFASYQWSNGQDTRTVYIDAPGTWSLTVTDVNGCMGATTLEALEYPSPSLQASSSADSICAGQPVTLSATNAVAYLWNTGHTSAQVTVQPEESATYSLTAWDDNGCAASAEVTVAVLPLPEFGLEQDGESIAIAGLENPEQYSFQWSTGETTPTAEPASPGLYCVRVTDGNGCFADACFEFVFTGRGNVPPPPSWQISPNPFENEVRIRQGRAPVRPEAAVFGLLGQPVPFRQRTEGEDIVLEFNGLPSGLYLIVMSDGENIQVAKMIKR
ncbi:MAG: metallophosphoesterase [Phaeodactylibacter sp.]|nr:metallophosphoesterase [Phaeodactylibacter sp.]